MNITDHRIGIVVVDHGSRRAEANAMLDAVVALFREHTGCVNVEAAHMELAEPTLAQAFDRCVARGAERVVIHPYFLAPGRHSMKDIPELAAAAAATHPGVPYDLTAPLGLDVRLAEVMRLRVEAALQDSD